MAPVVPTPTERLVGVDSLANRLCLSTRTIYRWCKGTHGPHTPWGESLPCHKIGRKIFFVVDDVERWMRQYGPSGNLRVEVPSSKIRRARKGKPYGGRGQA